MKKILTHGSLFSGIGGFDLAADWMGWDNKFHCEWNEFGQKILKYYWPNAESYGDITKTDFTIWRGSIDIITGGFPCQPYSVAGLRKGKDDSRHLWPEMLRAIKEIKPRWIVGENVRGIINWNAGLVFNEVQSDLEAEGYEVLPCLLPSASVGANNIRERIWFIAYANSLGRQNVQSNIRSSKKKICNLQRVREEEEWRKEKTNFMDTSGNSFIQFQKMYGESPIFDVDDELPFKLFGITVSKWIEKSMIAMGNSVNPKLVLQIFKSIQQYENNQTNHHGNR